MSSNASSKKVFFTSSRPVKQVEGDFFSLLKLCGWDEPVNLEDDFWVFILVLLYLGWCFMQ